MERSPIADDCFIFVLREESDNKFVLICQRISELALVYYIFEAGSFTDKTIDPGWAEKQLSEPRKGDKGKAKSIWELPR